VLPYLHSYSTTTTFHNSLEISDVPAVKEVVEAHAAVLAERLHPGQVYAGRLRLMVVVGERRVEHFVEVT